MRLGRRREALAECDGIVKGADLGGSGFYVHALQSLCAAALGRTGRARAAFKLLPREVVLFTRARMRRPAETPDAEIAETVERLLEESRGVRRVCYETKAWMR